jgi:hypothetical protein
MVANFNPSWKGIVDALRLAVLAAGGTPSVSIYPANWGGTIRAIDDLRTAIVNVSATAALAAHVAEPNPHNQYALDTDLAAYATNTSLNNHTSNTNNPHATTAAQVGAAAASHTQTASTITDFNEAAQDAVGTILTDSTSIDFTYNDAANTISAVALFGTGAGTVAQGNDARLSDTRIPTDGTVTDAKVATGAAIAWAKVSKTGAVASEVGAATAAQGTNSANHIAASANVHGLPASVNVLGNRNAAGEFIQHGSATVAGSSLAISLSNYRTQAVTFPVAFATVPRVVVGGSNTGFPVTATGASTTGFTMLAFGDAAIPATYVGNYLALGT